MTLLKTFDIDVWETAPAKEVQLAAIELLETGHILYFPALAFALNAEEKPLLTPTILKPKAKNISYSSAQHSVQGALLDSQPAEILQQMISRYCQLSRGFIKQLLPHYNACLAMGKTSFRPAEIAGRKTSYRKDDTRLHIDAFPSNPTQGSRILRVFTNINQTGQPRHWRVGEPLEAVLKRFLPRLSAPVWGWPQLLKWAGITKKYRTPYDHYMLGVHDGMKGDESYQSSVPYEAVSFPPGSTWIVYTDQVSHAAMSGQHVLEQTFNIQLESLKFPLTSPLKVMERLLQTTL